MFLIFREIPAAFPESFSLSADEYRHLRARRIRPGAAVHVGDGRGRRLEYRLRDSGDHIVQVAGAAPVEGAEACVRLFTAVPDGRRWDWLLQKATELGATAIQPVRFEYSEARKLKREREERIILEAAVQSRRFVLPQLCDELSFSQALAFQNATQIESESRTPAPRDRALSQDARVSGPPPLRLALDPCGDQNIADFFLWSGASDGPVHIFVGPEGGFSEQELQEFARAGCAICRLGATILRVETAALAALAGLYLRADRE